jgi:integrase
MSRTLKVNTAFPGVRYRKHKTRKHGIQLDKYFMIRYQHQGKRKEEGLGWASDGWTAKKASDELARIREAIRTGRGAQSLQEAREIARQEKEAEAERKAEQERLNTTVQAFWDGVYFPLARQKKKPKSWGAEEGLFRLWISPVIGSNTLSDVSPFDLEKIKQDMTQANLSARSIEYALAVVRQIFNTASDKGVFNGQNPSRRVKAPKFDNKRVRYLTPLEAKKLLAELKRRSPDVHDMALLSLNCGLRAGEVFSLQWGHVDFDGGNILILDTKSGVNRHVPMTATAKKMLKARQEVGQVPGLVFPARNGGKIKEMSKTFYSVLESLGFNDGIADRRQRVTFHSLRHTFASTHAQRGESLYAIAKLMGHGIIKMCERYSHLDPEKLKKTAERLEEDLNGSTEADVIRLEDRRK